MTESIVIALAGGLMGAVLAFPLGSFSGWVAWEQAHKAKERRRKAEKKRQQAQAAREAMKRKPYDFMHDETMKFPCVEDQA